MMIEEIEEYVKNKMPKEYSCHIQFVKKIGMEMMENHDCDNLVVILSCLLHDIGRIKSSENHADIGSEMIEDILKDFEIEEERVKLIIRCVRNHNKPEAESIEEKIVISADSASKVLYHESFVLMCKKENYMDKLKWNLEYLNKGFNNILIDKEKYREKYLNIKNMYEKIIQTHIVQN